MAHWGRLLRISLAPSAVADVLAGVVLGGGVSLLLRAPTWWLVTASLGIYHGGLVLNDWFDREHDARTRAQRPIPQGSIKPGAALVVGLLALGLGIASGFRVSPSIGLWMLLLAQLVLVYDGGARGPVSGPLTLAACRALNLGAGLWLSCSTLEVAPNGAMIATCLLYGLYVFLVSRLGHMEDGQDAAQLARRPSRLLTMAALVLAILPWVGSAPSALGWLACALVVWTGAFGLWRRSFEVDLWSPRDVERSMGLALRRLLVFTAGIAFLAWAPSNPAAALTGLFILAGLWASRRLAIYFPPS